MKQTVARLALSGLALATLGLAAQADESKPRISNVAGKIVHYNHSTGVVHLQLEKGNIWVIQMQPGSKFEKNQKPSNSSAFHEGDMISVGVTSSLTESPKKAVLMVDWGNSGKYVATTAPAPYTTPKGDFATTGGASSVNNVGGQRPDNTIGIMGNGGQAPTYNMENPNGTSQSVPNDPKGQSAQALKNTNAVPSNNATTRGQWMSPMQNMGINPYSTGLPSGAGLMGEDDPAGGAMPTGGPPMANNMGGQPMQMVAVVVNANPGSGLLVVKQQGSNVPTNVMVNPGVNITTLRPGQTISIMGTNSNGMMQASQILPMGNP